MCTSVKIIYFNDIYSIDAQIDLCVENLDLCVGNSTHKGTLY